MKRRASRWARTQGGQSLEALARQGVQRLLQHLLEDEVEVISACGSIHHGAVPRPRGCRRDTSPGADVVAL